MLPPYLLWKHLDNLLRMGTKILLQCMEGESSVALIMSRSTISIHQACQLVLDTTICKASMTMHGWSALLPQTWNSGYSSLKTSSDRAQGAMWPGASSYVRMQVSNLMIDAW